MKFRKNHCIFLLLIFISISGCESSKSSVEKVFPTGTNYIQEIPGETLEEAPMDTLSPSESANFVFDNLADNGGCFAPCIWGITPGVSDSNTLQTLFGVYSEISTSDLQVRLLGNFLDGGRFLVRSTLDNIDLEIILSYLVERNVVKELRFSARSINKQSEVIFGDKKFIELLSVYSLANMLNQHGIPTEVFIATWNRDTFFESPEWVPFSIVLYYPDQGILAEYLVPQKENDLIYQGCPSESQIILWLWSPSSEMAIDEIVSFGSGLGINPKNVEYFQPLEKVTSLSLNEFYETFRQENSKECIETPQELWP